MMKDKMIIQYLSNFIRFCSMKMRFGMVRKLRWMMKRYAKSGRGVNDIRPLNRLMTQCERVDSWSTFRNFQSSVIGLKHTVTPPTGSFDAILDQAFWELRTRKWKMKSFFHICTILFRFSLSASFRLRIKSSREEGRKKKKERKRRGGERRCSSISIPPISFSLPHCANSLVSWPSQ